VAAAQPAVVVADGEEAVVWGGFVVVGRGKGVRGGQLVVEDELGHVEVV
jgi:hypothetical protein